MTVILTAPIWGLKHDSLFYFIIYIRYSTVQPYSAERQFTHSFIHSLHNYTLHITTLGLKHHYVSQYVLHRTPTSSPWPQFDWPHPRCGQSKMVASDPVQLKSSSQMGPTPEPKDLIVPVLKDRAHTLIRPYTHTLSKHLQAGCQHEWQYNVWFDFIIIFTGISLTYKDYQRQVRLDLVPTVSKLHQGFVSNSKVNFCYQQQ